jgi:hypothetical protein
MHFCMGMGREKQISWCFIFHDFYGAPRFVVLHGEATALPQPPPEIKEQEAIWNLGTLFYTLQSSKDRGLQATTILSIIVVLRHTTLRYVFY